MSDIFALFKQHRWEEIPKFIEEFPSSVYQFDAEGNLPLHIAVANIAPVDLIQLILKVGPTSTKLANNAGLLPLHHAACGSSALVLKTVLEANPTGATVKDSEGNLPLHYALYTNGDPDIALDLLSAYTKGAQVRNNDNELPVQVAFHHDPVTRNANMIIILLEAGWKESGGDL